MSEQDALELFRRLNKANQIIVFEYLESLRAEYGIKESEQEKREQS